MNHKVKYSIIGISALIALFFLWTIKYSPLWLFTKYKKLRPLIVAQARFETDDFKSGVYWKYRNAFGMKIPAQRPSLRIGGSSNGYSIYLTPLFSLADLFLYFDEFGWGQGRVAFIMEGGFDLEEAARNYANELKIQGYYEIDSYNYAKGLISKL